jgi:hypothetical protein
MLKFRLHRLSLDASGDRKCRVTTPLAARTNCVSVFRSPGYPIQLAPDHACEQARLNLQYPPVADAVAEQRMRHQRVHPLRTRE